MSRIHESIQVDVPVRTAYNQWTQFEEFPRFMDGVERVVQVSDTILEWTAEVGGRMKTWTARITRQEPDQVIAWVSVDGAANAGTVSFHPYDGVTRIELDLDVEPDGPIETAGDALGLVERRAKGDLERFKAFIESRGVETGAWRGTVEAGRAR